MKTQKKKLYQTIMFLILMTTMFNLWISTSSNAQFKVTAIKTDQIIFDIDEKFVQYGPLFYYNRVQGPFLGIDASIYLNRLWQIKLMGNLGYGLEDTWRYQVGIQKSLWQSNPLAIGFLYYDQVSSLDEWFINHIENSIAALLIKDDFMDYFGKNGIIAFIDKKFADVHTIRIEVDQFQFESLSRQTHWALFGGNKRFRENPSVVEEKTTSVRLMWIFDWRDNPLLPISGWYLEGIGEQTFGDSVDTQGLFVTLKRFQPAFASHLVKLKLMLGTRKGCDQRYEQYLMDMGGLGTIVAYQDKEFKNGNRFLFATARYLFNGAILRRLPLGFLPFYDQLTLGIFAESGWLYFGEKNANPFSDFKSIKLSDFKSDIGISLYITEGLARIDLAKRTDRSTDDWRITFRLMHKF